MAEKRMPWNRPSGSTLPIRQGDYAAEPIYTALGKALSAWEGTNAAANSLHRSLHAFLDQTDHGAATNVFDGLLKTHDRAQHIRQLAATFLAADFGERRDEAAKVKKKLNSALASYVGWAAWSNELSHSYVTSAQCPDYHQDEQPIITVFALLPSHARIDRWHHAEPEWNYLADEIRAFANQFSSLDDVFEGLAGTIAELGTFRTAAT